MVQILHSLSGGPFPKIVETGDENQAAPGRIQNETDVAKIRVRDVLQLRQHPSAPDTNHGPSGIKLTKQSFDFCSRLFLIECYVDGGENPARERQQVRREDNLGFTQTRVLKDFRRMAVGEQAVRLEILIHLHKVEVAPRILARSAGPGFTVANDRSIRRDPA